MDFSLAFLLIALALALGFGLGWLIRSRRKSSSLPADLEALKEEMTDSFEHQVALLGPVIIDLERRLTSQLETKFAHQKGRDDAVQVQLDFLGSEFFKAREEYAESSKQQNQTLKALEERLQELTEAQRELTLASQTPPVETVYEDPDKTRVLVASDEVAAQAYAQYQSTLENGESSAQVAFDLAPDWEKEVDNGPAVITEKRNYTMDDADIPFDYDSWNA